MWNVISALQVALEPAGLVFCVTLFALSDQQDYHLHELQEGRLIL